MAFEQGRVVDGYTLTANAGSGGCSEVFETARGGHRAAVKAVLPGADEFMRGLFAQEVEILERFRGHPHFPMLLGSGEAEGRLYIVLEWLDHVNAKGKPMADQRVRFLAQICDALGTSHADGVTHRDLHPSNFRLAANGACKLIDWGVAHRPGSILESQPTRVTVTVSVMSPESFQGKFGDPRSDLYSIGCCLFFFLAGRFPYGETGSQAAFEERHRTYPIPQLSNPKLKDAHEYQALLDKILAKDPAARIGSAAELRTGCCRSRHWVDDGWADQSTTGTGTPDLS